MSAQDIQAEALLHGVWTGRWWLERQVGINTQSDATRERPLLPLGHLALFLAAGLLDNVELARPDEYEHLLIKGSTRKVQVDVTTPEEKDEGITRTVEEFRTTIHVLDLTTGEARCLNEPNALTAFVDRWQSELSRAVIDAYPPLHDLHLTDVEEHTLAALLQHKRPAGRRESGLLPVQKQAAAAGCKAINVTAR